MSSPTDLFSSLPPEPTGDDAGKVAATTVSGPAPHEGAHSFVPPPATVSSSHRAFENYGLQRPTDVTEIHVFRVILQPSRDKNACILGRLPGLVQ